MKKQNLLLAVLAIPMLASCGAKSGTKKPHNSVKVDEFLEKVEKEVTENDLFGLVDDQKAFSYVLNRQEKTSINFKYLKQGKKLYTEKEKYVEKTNAKFDSKKHILVASESVSEIEKGAEDNVKDKSSYTYIIESLNNSNLLSINPNTLSYTKAKMDESDKAVDAAALSVLSSPISLLEYALENTEFYVDKNVYTIVIEENETDNGESYAEETVYQLSIKKNSYSFVMTQKISDIDGEREKTVKSYSTTTLKRKSVSLKHANTKKMVEKDGGIDFF